MQNCWLFLFTSVIAFAETTEKSIAVEVTKAIGKRYFAGCTVLLQVEKEKPTWSFYRFAKLLMLSMEDTGCISISSFEAEVDNQKRIKKKHTDRCSRTLYVLKGDETTMKEPFTKLSDEMYMSGPVWLIFLDPKASIKEFLEGVNAPFDVDLIVAQLSENENGTPLATLKEAYRTARHRQLHILDYGSWSPSTGLDSPPHISLYYRRKDLEGITFRVGTRDNPPLTKVTRNGTKLRLSGFLADLWRDLEIRLNFSSEYVLSADNATGTYTEGKGWDGLMGMLYRNEIDIAVTELTMIEERYHVIDFLRPLIITKNQLFFKRLGVEIKWDAIFGPFRMEIWIIILAWILTASICLFLFYRIAKAHQIESEQLDFTIMNSILTTMRALCQQGSNVIPKSIPCRAIFCTSYLVATILVTAYSGALTSYVTVQQPRRPFTSLQGLLQDGTYRVELLRKTATYSYFAKSNNSVLKNVFDRLVNVVPEKQLPSNRVDAINNVCNNYKVAHFGTLFMTEHVVKQMNERGCEIITLENPLDTIYMTIGLSKRSQYRDALNHHLDMMVYQGLIIRLKRNIWPYINNHIWPDYVRVGIHQTVQILLILAGGTLFAIALFFGEIFYNKRETIKRSLLPFRGKLHLEETPTKTLLPLTTDRWIDIDETRPRSIIDTLLQTIPARCRLQQVQQ